MCGIAGIIGQTDRCATDALINAAHLQKHRGPDNFGYRISPQYALFHNRLSIIDTSASANQPIEDSRYILVFNGEIYNFPELAQQKLPEENFDHKSDTLVLFSLLKKFGHSIISELNGMFAFAFFDKERNCCLLARDRMGIKPLYYFVNKKMFVFASEIKTALKILESADGYIPKQCVEPRTLDTILSIGYGEMQLVPFRQIVELTPGCWCTVECQDTNSLSCKPYFSIPNQINISKCSRKDSLISELDQLINKSIDLHMRADVPVGTLCSGGLDSSLITALATKRNPSLKIYHADFEGPGTERAYAEYVAKYLKVDIEYVTMDANTFLGQLPAAVWHSDIPIYHPNDISLYAIAEKAKSDGVKVLLCGEGADELFGGYPWHRYYKNLLRFQKIGHLIPNNLKCSILLSFTYLSKFFTRNQLLSLSAGHINYTNKNLADFTKRNVFLRNPSVISIIDELRSCYRFDSNPELAAFITNNLYGHLSSILHRNDRMCMMASIESRVPFIENELIRFALNLDSSYKIKGKESKYLLKKVAETYLPHKIIYRTKMGFPVPFERFMQKCNNEIFNDGFLCNFLSVSSKLLLSQITLDPMFHFHALSVELWGRMFTDNTKPSDLTEKIIRRD